MYSTFSRLWGGTKVGVRMTRKEFARTKTTDKSRQEITFDIGGKKETYKVVDVGQESSKVYNWFSTLRGQKTVGATLVLVSVGVASYHIAPHSLGIGQVRALYQSYSKGMSNRITTDMKENLTEVNNSLNLKPEEKKALSLFVFTLSDPRGWGDLGGDAIIGYPEFFHWISEDQVPLDQMRFGGGRNESKSLSGSDMNSISGKSFAESMILSEDAKRFAIAREVVRIQKLPYVISSVVGACWVLLTYNLARLANRKLDLFKKPPIVRLSLYNMLAMVMGLGYLLVKDTMARQTERKVIKETANISREYATGGVEYYSKQMQRNLALRTLTPSLADKYTQDEGDIIYGLIRRKNISITEMRDLCRTGVDI